MTSMGYLLYPAFSESVFGCKGVLEPEARVLESRFRKLLKRGENGHLSLGHMRERNNLCLEKFA